MPTPAPLPHLRLLGTPQLAINGGPVEIKLRKAWGLLAYLALEGRATRSRLAGLLWSDFEEAAARRNLRRELHRLRETGLNGLVLGDDTFIALGDCVCDVHRFDQALTAGRNDEAVAIYRGPLLDGLDCGAPLIDDWLRSRRDRLHSRWQQAARAHAAALEAAGEVGQALDTVLSVLDIDALQEADFRHAMRLHDRCGDREAALALYERCRRALGQELGLRPMAETVDLAERIRRGAAAPVDVAPAMVRVAGTAGAGLALQAPLVGREAELAQLAAACDSGSARLLIVSGAAGIGKSRLAQAFAATRGAQAFVALPGDTDLAFAAVARWLRALGAESAPWPQALRRELSLVLPGLDAGGPAPDPASPRERLFDALVQAWQALQGDAHPLAVFDDAQWLDSSSFDWLLSLSGRSRAKMLLIARDEELGETPLRQLRRHVTDGTAQWLALAPLAPAATLELVRQLSNTAHGQRFAQRLHEATGGHPLFLMETLRHLVDSGVIRVDGSGRWHTTVDETTLDYAELPVPSSVHEAVLARVERLGDSAQRLLEAASCVRAPVRFELIARATALAEWEGVAAFERVLSARLMEPAGADRYRFTHDLIAQALSGALGPVRRRLIHRALAQACEQGHGEADAPAATVAQHWADGGEAAHAALWWERAAQRAEELGALDDALLHAGRALDAGAAAPSRVALHLQRVRLWQRRAETTGISEEIEHADAAARATGDAVLLAKVQLVRAQDVTRRDPVAAEALLEVLLAQPDLQPLLRSRAHQQRAGCARQRGDLARCAQECEAAARALPPGQWRSRGEIKLLQGQALMFSGDREAADLCHREAAELFHRSGDDAGRVRVLCARAAIAADRGRVSDSRTLCEQALELARSTYSVGLQRNAILNLLRALVAEGSLEAAQTRVAEGLALSPRFASINEEQALMEAQFTIALMAGDLGTAFDALPRLIDVSRRASELYRVVSGLLAPVDMLLQLEHARPHAHELIDEAERRLAGGGIEHLRVSIQVKRAGLMLALGQTDAAFDLATSALAAQALRAQDRPHAALVCARSRMLRGDLDGARTDLAAEPDDLNPEPATLIRAARLGLNAQPPAQALAWFDSGRAPPLERLTLARALLSHPGLNREPVLTGVRAEAARTVATMLQSLASRPDDQAALRQQFSDLI